MLLLSICLLFSLVYFAVAKDEADYRLIGAVVIGSIGLAWLLYMGVNRKYLRDLKTGGKKAVVKQVADKYVETSFEAGSGLPYIPILGDLFPRLWKTEPRKAEIYYIVVDGTKYSVEKGVFDTVEIQGDVEAHYTLHSGMLLGFATPEIQ